MASPSNASGSFALLVIAGLLLLGVLGPQAVHGVVLDPAGSPLLGRTLALAGLLGPRQADSTMHATVLDANTAVGQVGGGLGGVIGAVNSVMQGVLVQSPQGSFLKTMAVQKIVFNLYTKDSPTPTRVYPNATSVNASAFRGNRPTKIITHGYTCNTGPQSGCAQIKNALFARDLDLNVILMDWSQVDTNVYPLDVWETVPVVAAVEADLVNVLITSAGADPDSIHLLGHSLGGQISGIAANQSLRLYNAGWVTALDPAGPLYENTPPEQRLNPSVARFVEAIHTDGGRFGYMGSTADVDFFFNGGSQPQPGCPTNEPGGCSHCFAFRVCIYAIQNPSALVATKCSSQANYKLGTCSGGDTTVMGLQVNQTLTGNFFIDSAVPPANSADSQQLCYDCLFGLRN